MKLAVTLEDGVLVIRIPIRVETSSADPVLNTFTPRERQTFEHLITGKVNKEIAGFLGVSVRTVKYYVSEILKKTGCESRAELIYKKEQFQ